MRALVEAWRELGREVAALDDRSLEAVVTEAVMMAFALVGMLFLGGLMVVAGGLQ